MPAQTRAGLFRKYLTRMAAVVCAAVIGVGAFGIWTVYRTHKASLIGLQRAQAELAATKIGQFVREIEGQLGWTTQLSWSGALTLEERHLDAVRLLRLVPAITELALIDHRGHEQVRLSRTAMDVVGSDEDRSSEPAVFNAQTRNAHYGPVYFRRGSEPHFTLALAGGRADAGVSVAEVNLVHIWDVISQIKVGERGLAYVVDAAGRLIAHPDIGLVLRNTDLSGLAQVQAARAASGRDDDAAVTNLDGQPVLAAHAPIAPVGWTAFVEVPFDEAVAPVYASLLPAGVILILALLLAVLTSLVLARRMVKPIRALQTSAARIGAGALDERIDISTGDELEALGRQFNGMAARLQESYATLERRIAERTHELALANLAKTRFLAVASHDLRQPLHALNLFVAQLRGESEEQERGRLVARIESAVAAMNELFEALLDISRLDAGVTAPNLADFPVAHLLKRVETTFAAAARAKGIRLRVVPSRASVRSDFVLLERILLNLVSN
ncbi:MAG TPA: sensor histidine kinase, partial [Beijerinckiaceae bacterium]|nr:sensor histidine kinase [Beijerinckiaceae bacterium]